jgi:hypothetical protein
MKALSVRAPWPYFIMCGGKDIENRGLRFPRKVRGRVLIHQSKWWNEDEVRYDVDIALDMQAQATGVRHGLAWGLLKAWCGCIIGSVEIVDCVTESKSPWFVGDVGLVLRNPISLPQLIPYKGMLGFFEVPNITLIN